MKKILCIIVVIFAIASCSKDDEKEEIKIPDGNEGKGSIFLTLDVIKTDKPIENIHLYSFNNFGELALHKYFSSSEALSSEMLLLDEGDYIFVIIANVGEDFLPASKSETPKITYSDLMAYLKENADDYPDMATATVQQNIEEGVVVEAAPEVEDGVVGLKSTSLRLKLTLPDGTLSDFTEQTKVATKTQDYNLRAIAEVYKKGTDVRIHRYSNILSERTLDLDLLAGNYDILLWVDYIPKSQSHKTDYYYTTTQLSRIKFSDTVAYTGNTDSRDAHSLSFEATVGSDGVSEKSVTLERPFAKYRIIATDVERYRTFERINDYPSMEELSVTISYEGSLPSLFNVSSNKPIDSEAGFKYSTTLQDVPDSTANIGSDYVFVNGSESVVFVTISITSESGKKIAEIRGVEIDYRRNHLTTISGDFLTAGIVTGGITINTNWSDENNHDF